MAVRIYRLFLHLLPKSFRHEYGDEMTAALADRRREARGGARLLLWLEVLPDLLFTAVREHGSVLRQDLLCAWRTFRRAPGYAGIAIVTITLGVGANTAIFTVVDHSLLRPIPYADPGRLVTLWEQQPLRGYGQVEASPPNFQDWREMNDVFSEMAAYSVSARNLTGSGPPTRLEGTQTTSSLFAVLGVEPVRGRWLVPEDDGSESPEVVMLSHGFWRGHLGGDESVIGRILVLDGIAHEVVGVMPASFHFPHAQVDFWVPFRLHPDDRDDRSNNFLRVIARLRDGTSPEEAQAGMEIVASRLAKAYPDPNEGSSVVIRPLRDQFPQQTRLALIVLALAALGVLLIGCANLANLLLARATERRKELAVRAALGAGSERLVRQILTENLLLAVVGGALGVLTAVALLPVLAHLIPTDFPIAGSPRIDARVLGFGFLLSLVTGLLFGVYPAWRLSREATGLREHGRVGVSAQRGRVRNALVVTEVALSVILLIGTGLLIRALWQVSQIDPGFRTEGVLRMNTSLPLSRYGARADRERFYNEVLSRARELPGVESAGYTGFLPFVMRGIVWPVAAEENPQPTGSKIPLAVFRVITEGYLETMEIPILEGRDFDSRDSQASTTMAVVSASFVKRLWPDQDPIGRRFSFLQPWTPDPWTVVGVVPDIRARGLERRVFPQVYVLHRQVTGLAYHAPRDLALRISGDSSAVISALRRVIWDVDPEQAISNVQMMEELLAAETAGRRNQLRLLGVFAALAFLMASLGIHGVLSYLVSLRTQEIGVRMALGAGTIAIIRMILGKGMALTLLGLVIGLAGGLGLGYSMRTLLFGVQPFDAQVLTATVILCLMAATTACYLPAWRAARVDPMTAVRAD